MPKEKNKQQSAPSRMNQGVKKQKNLYKKITIFIKKYKKIISFCISAVITLIFVISFKDYANRYNLNSEFYLFWSEFIYAIMTAIAGDVVASILAKIKFGKNGIWIFAMLLCAIAIFFSIAGILRIKGLCVKNIEENQRAVEEKQTDKIIYNSDTIQNKTYYASPYIFEEDPFFERKEEYFGVKKGSLSEDEIIQYMAKCVYENIDFQQLDNTEIPDAYSQHTQAANSQYDTYLFQRKRDWDLDKENTYSSNYIKQIRIDDLKSVIDERILADGEYINYENRRQIAICYKDLGDEYAHIDNQNEAANAFEECAKWAMKSMHVAIRNSNYDEYRNALKQLSNASDAMSSLNAIGEPRKDRITVCYTVYEFILNVYMN